MQFFLLKEKQTEGNEYPKESENYENKKGDNFGNVNKDCSMQLHRYVPFRQH